jgi:hypothetical protein
MYSKYSCESDIRHWLYRFCYYTTCACAVPYKLSLSLFCCCSCHYCLLRCCFCCACVVVVVVGVVFVESVLLLLLLLLLGVMTFAVVVTGGHNFCRCCYWGRNFCLFCRRRRSYPFWRCLRCICIVVVTSAAAAAAVDVAVTGAMTFAVFDKAMQRQATIKSDLFHGCSSDNAVQGTGAG